MDCYRSLTLLGSIIRSRQASGQKSASVPGFGSQTSLHLESTPDICGLLTTYLSSLPQPILSPFPLLPIWDWCGLEADEADANQYHYTKNPPDDDFPLSRSHTRTRTPRKRTTFISHSCFCISSSRPTSCYSSTCSPFSAKLRWFVKKMDDLSCMFGGRIIRLLWFVKKMESVLVTSLS